MGIVTTEEHELWKKQVDELRLVSCLQLVAGFWPTSLRCLAPLACCWRSACCGPSRRHKKGNQDQSESQVPKDQKVTQVSVVPEDVLELQERMVLQDQTAEKDPEDPEVHQDHVSMEPL